MPTTTPPLPDVPVILCGSAEPRVDARLLAKELRNKYKSVSALIERYTGKFKEINHLPFKKEVGSRKQGGGNAVKVYFLDENQAIFLLSLSRNTPHVVTLKVKLVKAFSEARRAAMQHGAEYLPTYHQLHDQIHALANGAPHERFIHMNANKLVNKAAGIGSGQRGTVPLASQALLIVAQMAITKAMKEAPDHHEGYRLAKDAVKPLLALTA